MQKHLEPNRPEHFNSRSDTICHVPRIPRCSYACAFHYSAKGLIMLVADFCMAIQ